MDTFKEIDLESKELTRSYNGLGHVNWSFNDDFKFVAGDDKVCCVTCVLAEFLSPKVACLRRSDISFDVYKFNNNSSDVFNVFDGLVSSLRTGTAFRVDKSNFHALLELSCEFGNSELCSSLFRMIKTESMRLDQAMRLFEFMIDHGISFDDRFAGLRDFVASHFYEIDEETLSNLDLETMDFILSSPSLTIRDEDSLYEFVKARSENDPRFTSLFRFICFEYLSILRITKFASFISDHFPEKVDSEMWSRICRRLVLRPIVPVNPRDVTWMNFVCGESPYVGIIEWFTRECGGNPYNKGIIDVDASSIWLGGFPSHAVDLASENWFSSQSERNSWIVYDFKGWRVVPTSSSLHFGGETDRLENWVIEVSNDGHCWTEIDRRETNGLDDVSMVKNFKIGNVLRDGVKFFRLRQVGPNQSGTDILKIVWLEIFGILSVEEYPKKRPADVIREREEEPDASMFDEDDIRLVMEQGNVSRLVAIERLRYCHGDITDAVLLSLAN